MTRQEYVAAIRHECEATDGFLIELRNRNFSIDCYNRLIQALRMFRETIRGQDFIERDFLDLEMRAALNYLHNDVVRKAFQEAQIECSELILEILTREYMLESQ